MLSFQRLGAVVLTAATLSSCSGYRVIRADEIDWPDYEPREVLVPEKCDTLVRRAAVEGMTRFSEAEANELAFCQQQHLIRAQEEEAVAARLEAHAEAASFGLRVATTVVGALVFVLAWAF